MSEYDVGSLPKKGCCGTPHSHYHIYETVPGTVYLVGYLFKQNQSWWLACMGRYWTENTPNQARVRLSGDEKKAKLGAVAFLTFGASK